MQERVARNCNHLRQVLNGLPTNNGEIIVKKALLVFLIMHCQILFGGSVPVPKVILPTIFDCDEIHCDKVKVDVYAHTTSKESRPRAEDFLVPGPMNSQFKVVLSYSNNTKIAVSRMIGILFDKETCRCCSSSRS